jgi:DNA-directed RNA polymerase beta subunit
MSSILGGKSVLGNRQVPSLAPASALQSQPAKQKPLTPDTPDFRDFGDSAATRNLIYERVLNAARTMQPVENSRHILRLSNVDYADKGEYSLEDQKKAIMANKTLGRRLAGTWELLDKATGDVIDKKQQTVARVPYFTDRNTVIYNGVEYTLCLHGSSRVWTDRGLLPIADIVRKKLAVQVRSFDFESQTWVWKPVVGWYENPVLDGMGCARFTNVARLSGEFPRLRTGCLWATPGHNVFLRGGDKKPISDTDHVLVATEALSYTQEQLLYGSLLGDAHIRPDGLYQCLHGGKQKGYAQLKRDILSPVTTERLKKRRVPRDGRRRATVNWRFRTRAHVAFHDARRLCYVGRRKTVTKSWLARVDVMGLAFWFMDGGDARYTRDTNHVVVGLHTQSFSRAEIGLLQEWLQNKWGWSSYTERSKKYEDRDCGWIIRLSGDSAQELLDAVARFVPQEMQYKLLNRPKTGSCRNCNCEIEATHSYCDNCLLLDCQQRGKSFSRAARDRFGGSVGIRETLASGDFASQRTGTERWDRRKAVAGSAVAGMRSDTALKHVLVETPVVYEEGRGLRYEQAKTAFDIQVADTHNYVANGVLVSNSNQLRLRPGIFTRVRENGEVEAHVNIMPGQGVSHRYFLDPEKGVFNVRVGQAKIPLLPMLRAMGATDKQLIDAWGVDLWHENAKQDTPASVTKLFERLLPSRDAREAKDDRDRRERLAKFVSNMGLDPEVTKRTLGQPYDKLNLDTVLATTKKLLAVSRGEQEVDDRDNLAYQTVHGPEDLLSERLEKDYSRMRRQLLHKASFQNSLKSLPPGALTKQLDSVILGSGLGMTPEEINSADILDKQSRITRMGEGGIESDEAVPDEARNVQPSHFAFLDPIRTPESGRVGIDTFIASSAKKGRDGKIYAPVIDLKTGKTVYKTPQELNDSVIAFPGELNRSTKRIQVMKGGRLDYAKKEDVQYVPPNFENAFSPLANMIPGKSAAKQGRMAMGARYLTQALPLVGAQSPLVQSAMHDGDKSYEDYFGSKMGAIRAKKGGRVLSINENKIRVQYDDGEKADIEMHRYWPYNRKTMINNTPTVEAGQRFDADQLLARSNFTDEKGVTALGTNLRVGYLPFRGLNFEDAVVISQSAANKKLVSEHMYQNSVEFSEDHKTGKRAFLGLFPGRFKRSQLDLLDDDGVVKPGTVLRNGDPIIALAKKAPQTRNKVHKRKQDSYTDASEVWEHHDEALVTDVFKNDKGVNVLVQSTMAMQVGDKLCYDEDTEVLTRRGWVSVADVRLDDEVCTLQKGDRIRYLRPTALHRHREGGDMYRVKSQQVDLFVTAGHEMYVRRRGDSAFGLHKARDLFGKRVQYQKSGVWVGRSPEAVVLPGFEVRAGQSGNGTRMLPDVRLSVETYLTLLGVFVSEGNLVDQPKSGSFGIDITQIKQPNRRLLLAELDRLGIRYNEHGCKTKIRIYSKVLLRHFEQFGGTAAVKRLPSEIFDWAVEDLIILFRWLMWGAGHAHETGRPVCYTTTSPGLADDIQRLCLHIGYAANVVNDLPETVQVIKGVTYKCLPRYSVRIVTSKLTPMVNHGHTKKQKAQEEYLLEGYDRPVYCVTVPGHVLYVRRNGKPCWSGNSGRYGDKGVVAAIIPDEEMPKNSEGRPMELLVSPLGTISRTNPIQAMEAGLGKLAEKMGQAFKLKDFTEEIEDLAEWTIQQLKPHGIKLYEDLEDPETGKKIPNILTGNRFFMKLHHTSESKAQGRGTGGYTMDNTPAKGGPEGAKRISLLDSNALLAHGATETLRDAGAFRGQKMREDTWLNWLQGRSLGKPDVPVVYQKFLNQLRAAGINVLEDGPSLHIMAMTNKDVDNLAEGRFLTSSDTVAIHKDLEPLKGGLFDPGLTGGHNGNKWSAIKLAEPLPNPVMEEPIRRLLGLTQKKFEAIISGKEKMQDGSTGPSAIAAALGKVNVDKEIDLARLQIASGRKTYRDQAVRKLGYLKAAKKLNVHPKDWMMEQVPVIPPRFRPIALMSDKKLPLVADANYLYRELFDANTNLQDMQKEVDDVGDERLALYSAFKAVTGLGDPVHPKLQEKNISGFLKQIFSSSPKMGTVQRRLLSSTVDMVGRSVITPNPDLDMDHIGLPENKAWEVYRPFIVRSLRKRGLPLVEAFKQVQDKTELAKAEMLKTMDERPILTNRAPVLHRHGILAFRPKLVKGDTLQLSPLVVKGFNADFDGDAMQYHVPLTDEARDEYLEKLLPSRNLISSSDFKSPVHLPSQDYVAGLYFASAAQKKGGRKHVFRNEKDVLAALMRGEIDADDQVQVLD